MNHRELIIKQFELVGKMMHEHNVGKGAKKIS